MEFFDSRITIPIKSNEEMEDITKIFKSLKDFGLLIKVTKTIGNDTKNQNVDFLVLGRSGASLLGNILAYKRPAATRQGRGMVGTVCGVVQAMK